MEDELKYQSNVSEIEEEFEWVQNAQKDISAFSLLYDKYYVQIFRFIYSRVETQEEAADLCSETFLKAMHGIKKYSYKGVPFKSWLYKIALNEVRQYYRNQNKQRVLYLDDQLVMNLKDDVQSSDLEFNLEILKKSFAILDNDELELLDLKYFRKKPYKEISVVLEISESNAKVKVFRIVQKLKNQFVELLKSEK